jgi:hypothetical protein
MRSKVFMHRWLIIRAKNSHKCHLLNLNSFELMIALAANKAFTKFKKPLLANFDCTFEIKTLKTFTSKF